MKLPIFLICVTLSAFSIRNANAQQVHAILVADTLDGSIGAGIKENLKNVHALLADIEIVGEIPVIKTEVKDTGFNCKAINDAVSRLQSGPNDAVLFFYSGHGFRRDSTQTRFPEFDCRRTSDLDRGDMATIVQELLTQKRPRFLLAVADTCNKEVPGLGFAAASAPFEFPAERKAAFRRLFLDYTGALMMSGAVPGEFSWYRIAQPTPTDKLGGYFTNQLLRVLDQRILENGGKIRWEDIATDATKTIAVPTNPVTFQTPQSAPVNLAGKKL